VIFSHFASWYIWLLAANFKYRVFDSGFVEKPMNLLFGLAGMWPYTYVSLVLFWVTIPAGALIGPGYSYYLINRNNE